MWKLQSGRYIFIQTVTLKYKTSINYHCNLKKLFYRKNYIFSWNLMLNFVYYMSNCLRKLWRHVNYDKNIFNAEKYWIINCLSQIYQNPLCWSKQHFYVLVMNLSLMVFLIELDPSFNKNFLKTFTSVTTLLTY